MLGDLAADLDVELHRRRRPASAVKMRPSFSASGMPGRTSSAMAPPWTLTASGTSSPASASRTDRATDTPAFSCASSVLAPSAA